MPETDRDRRIRYRGLVLLAVPSQLVPNCWGFQVWQGPCMVAFKNGLASAASALSEARVAANEYLAGRSEL